MPDSIVINKSQITSVPPSNTSSTVSCTSTDTSTSRLQLSDARTANTQLQNRTIKKENPPLPTATETAAKESLFNKILGGIGTGLSVLGGLGSFAGCIITICSLAEIAICPPVAAIGLIAAGISFVGLLCDIVNKATNKIKYDDERNSALKTQVGGYIVNITSAVMKLVAPTVSLVVSAIGVLGSAISLSGFFVELNNDYKNKRLYEEYGIRWIAKFLTGFVRFTSREDIEQNNEIRTQNN